MIKKICCNWSTSVVLRKKVTLGFLITSCFHTYQSQRFQIINHSIKMLDLPTGCTGCQFLLLLGKTDVGFSDHTMFILVKVSTFKPCTVLKCWNYQLGSGRQNGPKVQFCCSAPYQLTNIIKLQLAVPDQKLLSRDQWKQTGNRPFCIVYWAQRRILWMHMYTLCPKKS